VLVRLDHVARCIVNADHNGEWLGTFGSLRNPLIRKSFAQSEPAISILPAGMPTILGCRANKTNPKEFFGMARGS
jgi:hypothetical protein